FRGWPRRAAGAGNGRIVSAKRDRIFIVSDESLTTRTVRGGGRSPTRLSVASGCKGGSGATRAHPAEPVSAHGAGVFRRAGTQVGAREYRRARRFENESRR